jgi:hypothetical protein
MIGRSGGDRTKSSVEEAASLEFQWIKVRSFVEEIDIFDSF